MQMFGFGRAIQAFDGPDSDVVPEITSGKTVMTCKHVTKGW